MSNKQLNDIMKRSPDQKIVGRRWVLTEKVIQSKQDHKARSVVQGCQEDKGYIRTRCAHGIERRLLHDALSSSSRRLGTYNVFEMLNQRISSQMASRDNGCCGCQYKKIRLLGRNQGECLLQVARSTGRKMLDVRWS